MKTSPLAARPALTRRAWHLWRVLLGSLAVLPAVSGHPLGQQSVDHYSQLEIAPGKVIVVYDLDLAEVATFQESRRIDTNGDGVLDEAEKTAYAAKRARELAVNLHLDINGQPLALSPTNPKVFLQTGEGNLPLLRLVAVMESAPGTLRAALHGDGVQTGSFRDDNEPERIGWRRIGVTGLGPQILGLSIKGQPATVNGQGFATSASGDGADVRALEFRFTAPEAAAAAPPSAAIPPTSRQRDADPFVALMTAEHLTPARAALFLLIAAGLGGLHALAPGHGKTLVAAYLVGSRGTVRHAVALGLIVTVTHTAGVFALGVVTLFASRYLLPETLYPWLAAISGLVVAQLGLFRLFGRAGHHHSHHHHDEFSGHHHAHEHGHHEHGHHEHGHHEHGHHEHGHHEHGHHEHGHAHPHEFPHVHGDEDGHGHSHAHDHLPPEGAPITWRGLTALGVSGGLLPCPSALVVLLSAIALHRIGFGLLLIVAFSLGLAGVLTAVGIAVVHAHQFLSQRAAIPEWFLRYAPKVGAAAILVIGLMIAFPAVVALAKRYGG